MRPPRYRFPDEVRSATRGMAAGMVRDGTVPGTPEALDRWIGERPETAETLARGGYGTEFTSEDLFPLLQVFVANAGGSPAPAPGEPRPRSRGRWLLAAVVAAAVVAVVAFALAAA